MHGARKGNLKRLSNYFNSAEDIPLERLRLSDLEKRLEAVAENILAYDLIQNRLEEVAGAEALVDEEFAADVLDSILNSLTITRT